MKNINPYKLDERDRSFSPYRIPYADEAQAIVDDVLNQVRRYELYKGIRARGRRRSAHDNLVAAVTALVSDLMHRAVTSENGDGRIHLSRDTSIKRRTRYQAEFEGRPLVEAIDLIAQPELAFAKLVAMGQYSTGRQSAYKAGKSLLDRIDDNGISADDLTLRGDEEIVILKQAKEDLRNADAHRAGWIDYIDTELSNQYRDEVRTINAYLREADIGFNGNRMIDLTNRRQRRYFNNASFMEGGRLFGGFWLNGMRARERKHLSINGRSVIEADYRAMMPSLAYANQGETIPADQDPYTFAGLQQYRTGIKRIFAAMLFATKPLSRWPSGVREENFRDFDGKLSDVVNAIKAHHPALEPLWFNGVGHHFHFMESELIVSVLLECVKQDITALQTHDGVVVPFNNADAVSKLMREKFHEQTGQDTVVANSAVRLPRNTMTRP